MSKKNRFITRFLVLLFAITISQLPANSQQMKPAASQIRSVYLIQARGSTYETTEILHHHWERSKLQWATGLGGKKIMRFQTVSGYPVDIPADEIPKETLTEMLKHADWRPEDEKHPRRTLAAKTVWLVGSNIVGGLVDFRK